MDAHTISTKRIYNMSYFGSSDRFLDDDRYKSENIKMQSKNKINEDCVTKCNNEDCRCFDRSQDSNCIYFGDVNNCETYKLLKTL